MRTAFQSRLPLAALVASLVISTSLAAAPALAQEKEGGAFFVNLGYGRASFRTTGQATVAGQPVPGAEVALRDVGFVALEVGRRLNADVSIALLGGLPPTVSLEGRGVFAPYGELRKVRYGTVMLGGQLHPLHLGRFEPYAGAGLGYTFILNTHGGSMEKLDVSNTVGPYVQLGGRYHVAGKLSLFLDFRKMWQSFDTDGVAAGGIPAAVHISPDPVTGSAGISWRF